MTGKEVINLCEMCYNDYKNDKLNIDPEATVNERKVYYGCDNRDGKYKKR